MVTRLRVVGVLLLVLGGIAALMGWAQAFDPPPLLHSSLRSPVLALELVRSADDARSVLRDPDGEHNRAVMRRLIDLDWYFIAAYALAFCGLGLVLRACRWSGARALGTLAIRVATNGTRLRRNFHTRLSLRKVKILGPCGRLSKGCICSPCFPG
jgi:hypothetical protein